MEEIEEAEALQLAMVASIQAKEEEERRRKEMEMQMKKEKEVKECVEAAKVNLELLESLTKSEEDMDLLITVQDTCTGLKNTLSRYLPFLYSLFFSMLLFIVPFLRLQKIYFGDDRVGKH